MVLFDSQCVSTIVLQLDSPSCAASVLRLTVSVWRSSGLPVAASHRQAVEADGAAGRDGDGDAPQGRRRRGARVRRRVGRRAVSRADDGGRRARHPPLHAEPRGGVRRHPQAARPVERRRERGQPVAPPAPVAPHREPRAVPRGRPPDLLELASVQLCAAHGELGRVPAWPVGRRRRRQGRRREGVRRRQRPPPALPEGGPAAERPRRVGRRAEVRRGRLEGVPAVHLGRDGRQRREGTRRDRFTRSMC